MKDNLLTCPPMLGHFDLFANFATNRGLRVHRAQVTQILSEDKLCAMLPEYDGWIIGDMTRPRAVCSKPRKRTA